MRGRAGAGADGAGQWEALRLNPRLFVDSVRSTVLDLLDGAFHFCLQTAQQVVGGDGEENSDELQKGAYAIQSLVRDSLDKKMDRWEAYCLKNCFSIPEGFSSETTDDAGKELLLGTSEGQVDSQLDSLRKRLAIVGKESQELHREISSLEKCNFFSSKVDASVAEIQETMHSVHETVKEMLADVPILHHKMLEMKRKRDENMEQLGRKCLRQCQYSADDAGSSLRIEDIQELSKLLSKDST